MIPSEIEHFGTDEQFHQMLMEIDTLVERGLLKNCGLAPEKQPWFVEIYTTHDGEEWRLAHPDQAFRGYLKRTRKA